MAWHENVFTRVFGGTHEKYVGTPLVRGYGFVYIELPTKLGFTAEDSAKLAALSRSITGMAPITLDTEAIEGIGGVKFNVPTKLTMPDRFTIEYMEMVDEGTNVPFVFNVHKRWINQIRDFRFGASSLTGADYSKANFSGVSYVWITLPDCETVVEAYVLTGVIPTNLPIDALGFNVTDVAKIDLSFEYVFDHIYWYGSTDERGQVNNPIAEAFASKLGSYAKQVREYYKQFVGK